MDLQAAIHSHSQWKQTFRGAIERELRLDAERIARDDCCEVGQMLKTLAPPAGDPGALRYCVECHSLFHREAGQIASTVNQRNYREAIALLEPDSPYSRAALDVVRALNRLDAALRAQPPEPEARAG